MEYTVKALAQLAGTTPRALRWYDTLGLLKPKATTQAGYRLYGPAEVDRLQQILFYRELGLSLEAIGEILDRPGFDRQEALQSHLEELDRRRERLDQLILTVEQTLREAKGEIQMTDQEKFEVFKRELVEEKEARYGAEVRRKYGDACVDESDQAILGLSYEAHQEREALGEEIKSALAAAVRAGEAPAGAEGQRIARLHGKWLCFGGQQYDPRRHAGIAQLYVADQRFTAYYDGAVAGCAAFLRDAVEAYTKA